MSEFNFKCSCGWTWTNNPLLNRETLYIGATQEFFTNMSKIISLCGTPRFRSESSRFSVLRFYQVSLGTKCPLYLYCYTIIRANPCVDFIHSLCSVIHFWIRVVGGAGWIRITDTQIFSLVLYQLSYRTILFVLQFIGMGLLAWIINSELLVEFAVIIPELFYKSKKSFSIFQIFFRFFYL